MKILLINNEIWNDVVSGNNIFQNWFEGMDDVEIRVICTEPGKPLNQVCNHYFQVTDSMMAKSLLGKKAGISYFLSFEEMKDNPQTMSFVSSSGFYSFMKKISGTPVRLLREFIWCVGRYDKEALKNYIEEFKPDIVFSPHLFNWKSRRLERLIHKYTPAPIIAFAGDDEVSFRQVSYNPLYWINRFLLNRAFRKQLSLYSHYFTNSEIHAQEYKEKYGISASALYKAGTFANENAEKEPNNPLKLVYAGRLYCNRWKSLAKVGEALKKINKDGVKMILEVYSPEQLTPKQKKALSEDNFIYFKGSVTPSELKEIYHKADIALHVESLDKRNRLKTRLSFSTKIIDLMDSGCAILAIAWNQHGGYKYLENEDAAFCVGRYEDIFPALQKICENPSLVEEYVKKAKECGKKNHSKDKIHNQIKETFQSVIGRRL